MLVGRIVFEDAPHNDGRFNVNTRKIKNERKLIGRITALLVVCVPLLVACSPAQDETHGEAAATQGTPTADEARTIAKEAYIFTYGLVMNYRTMYRQAIDQEPGSSAVGLGNWLHLGLASPKDKDIVTPNNDTPYSYAWVDLRAEPCVLTMPKVEPDRFYTSQWDDLWAYVLDNVGSVNDGNDGTSVLLASPSWKGEVPEGLDRVIRGESDFLGTLSRVQVVGGMQDLSRAKEIQQSYKLQPLSDYLGKEAPAAAPSINWMPWVENDEKTEKYWDYVAFNLRFITPHPDDREMYEKMALIGLKRGSDWEREKLDPAIRKAMQEGLEDARAELVRLSQNEIDPAMMAGTRQKLNPTHQQRALGVYMGIFVNVPEQSIYFVIVADEKGSPLDGKQNYSLTFTKDQIPPVKYFWSLTMYNLPERFLIDNPIDRYSIGSSTPGLKTAEDGSITLYMSVESPGEDKESNWLPAPEGPWWVVMRTYGPGETIRDKTWKVPPVKQVD